MALQVSGTTVVSDARVLNCTEMDLTTATTLGNAVFGNSAPQYVPGTTNTFWDTTGVTYSHPRYTWGWQFSFDVFGHGGFTIRWTDWHSSTGLVNQPGAIRIDRRRGSVDWGAQTTIYNQPMHQTTATDRLYNVTGNMHGDTYEVYILCGGVTPTSTNGTITTVVANISNFRLSCGETSSISATPLFIPRYRQ